MIKYTHKENEKMIQILNAQAHGIGLLEPSDNLVYEKGARGAATVIRVVRKHEDGQRENLRRPEWVPEFGYKYGPSMVGNMIVAAGGVIQHLYTEQINREHEERKRKMSALSEHVARRSGREDL
jgi:hypothetical protein